nr:reverse transcriptase domain-containing protein [Tanacetum cinerariifolium]
MSKRTKEPDWNQEPDRNQEEPNQNQNCRFWFLGLRFLDVDLQTEVVGKIHIPSDDACPPSGYVRFQVLLADRVSDTDIVSATRSNSVNNNPSTHDGSSIQQPIFQGNSSERDGTVCMRTRSSSNLPVVSPPNPSTSNPKRRNCRRSKQPFILEESPVDTMANQCTMAELLRAPTEGYAEAIVVPSILAEQFELKHSLINMMTSDQFFGLEKDNPHDHIRWGTPPVARKRTPAYKYLLRPCPHHGFTELHQLDTFYNALNPTDQDSLNFAAGGNLLERRTQDVLTIIENKSKVCNSRNKSVVSQVKSCDANSNSSSEIAKLTHAVNQQTSVVTTAMTAILKQFQATPPPASCLATGGNTFPELRDNIQGYVSAAVVNYNQGNSIYRPPANQAICTPAGIVRDVFVPVGKFTFPSNFVIVGYESNPRVPLILERPFLWTVHALIDVYGEEMILRDGDERLTLNMRHDTSCYSNQPQKESINLINVFNDSKIAKLTHAVNQQTSVVTTAMTAILKQFQATPPPASVKAIEEICLACGGAHLYYQCLAAGGNTFPELRDNIQGYVSAAVVNYNQGNSVYRPPGSGSLPSNTIANPKGKLKAITTRNGIVLDGPSVPTPLPFVNSGEDERVEETLTDHDLSEYSIKVPPPPKLGLPELISTRMTLELANQAICTPAGIVRDVFVSVGKFTFPSDFVIVGYESNPRVPLILERPFLWTVHALIDVHGEEMILRDEGGNVLPEKLLDLDSTKDLHPPLHVNLLSGSTTYSYSPSQLLKEFADEHALITFPLKYDDDLFKVESDTENVYDDPFDSKGEKIKKSKLLIDELDLPCDFLLPSEYDSFPSKDFSRVDAFPSTNNEDKVFNPGILIQENLFKIITHVVQDNKLAISHASLMIEDLDPPLYELPFFKEVPRSKILLLFSSENEEKVFKPGIHTSGKVHSSLITELSHQGYKVFKINQILKSSLKIFLFSYGKNTHILVGPCLHFYPP